MLFIELMTEGRRLYKLIADKKAENDTAVDSLRKMGVYNQDYIQRMNEKLEKEFEKVRDMASLEFYGMVQKTVSEKRVALNKMLADAPTAEQTNLLTALQIQGKALDPQEVKSIAVQFAGNYRALRALKAMAEKAGIRLAIPTQYDYQELSRTLDRAEKYLMDCFHDLDTFTNRRSVSFNGRAFFHMWPDGDSPEQTYTDKIYSTMAEMLDGNQRTNPETTVEPRTLSDAEKAAVENLFSGVNRVAMEEGFAQSGLSVPPDPNSVMNQIMNSPELLALVKLHPEYGKLLK